jgi:hypothetical protein
MEAMMKRTTFCKDTHPGVEVTQLPNKTIVLPFDEATYPDMLNDNPTYKAYLQSWIDDHPELFPETIGEGWSLNGFTRESAKQGIRQRRIITTADQEVWHIRPAFVMPYMTCETATAEQILFLRKWAPVWALAHAFHTDVMFIHRLTLQIGRYNLVGTTVKQPEAVPKDVGADEKHATISGETVYAATTVAENCFLGGSISPGVGEADLTEAYRQFQREAQQVQPEYQPDTVNTDGWQATMNAWRRLFPSICVIQCFLHAVLRIRQAATTATMAWYRTIIERVWDAYAATTKRQFSQRLRRLHEWGKTLHESALKTALLKLCQKKAGFLPAYDFPTCLRTSNMVDRLMRGMDRYLFAHQGFHGTLVSAEYGIRSYCLLTNFRPFMYNPTAGDTPRNCESPFTRLNEFTYHECWLQNLLIATSGQAVYKFRCKKVG